MTESVATLLQIAARTSQGPNAWVLWVPCVVSESRARNARPAVPYYAAAAPRSRSPRLFGDSVQGPERANARARRYSPA